MNMFKRLIFPLSIVAIVGSSCSSHKAVSIPVYYKGWSRSNPDSTNDVIFFSGDGRLELKRYNWGENVIDWKLSIEDSKEDIFLIYSEDVQINLSSYGNMGIRLTPEMIEQPEELSISDPWIFVLSGFEFFMRFENPSEVDPDFYIEGAVNLKEKELARRIRRLWDF